MVAALRETPIKKELIVTVDLGPFKHVVDQGAPIRKAAYSLLQNIAVSYSFNQTELIQSVINGIVDTNEDV